MHDFTELHPTRGTIAYACDSCIVVILHASTANSFLQLFLVARPTEHVDLCRYIYHGTSMISATCGYSKKTATKMPLRSLTAILLAFVCVANLQLDIETISLLPFSFSVKFLKTWPLTAA